MAIRKVLIANRGEIAVRIINAAHDLGIEVVLAASQVDSNSRAGRLADRVVVLGPAPSKASYLVPELIVHAALSTSCDAIHPGYGFLSERAALPRLCDENGLIFVGPEASTIDALGNKVAARKIAQSSSVPLVRGANDVANKDSAKREAEAIGYPVLIKAASGGGGRGMFVARDSHDIDAMFDNATMEAKEAFGDGNLYLEQYIENARHIEVQIAGDGMGKAVHFGDRDCSIQRRYQKVIEEGPCSVMSAESRDSMRDAAVKLMADLSYRNVGTVEFVYDMKRDEFYFIEVNTRIQVEHPVSEQVSGFDLVKLQFAIANGDLDVIPCQTQIKIRGHAIECRINAEDPENGFRPSPGRIETWSPPSGVGVRIDSHCFSGYNVPPFYDSMIGKLIVTGANRDVAIERMAGALEKFSIDGIKTNLKMLSGVLADKRFHDNHFGTKWLEEEFLNSENKDGET